MRDDDFSGVLAKRAEFIDNLEIYKMKRINRTLRLLAVAAVSLGSLLSTAPAQAITVSISPPTQTIGVGGSTSVNIVVSGLTQAVGGFSLNLGFDDSLLSGFSYAIDPNAKMGAYDSNNDFSFGFDSGVGSPLDLFYVADATLGEAALAALQGASFTLATITFDGIAAGLSPLTLIDVRLSESDGITTLSGVTSQNGEICVQAAGSTAGCPREVPEPGTLALLSLGMLGMGLARRRRSA